MTELHPLCRPLEPLLGTWRGSGSGGYPTIEGFSYTEELVFGHVGKPFLAMTQRTRGGAGEPLHAEAGYLRALPGAAGEVELVVAQPSGIVEVHTGTAAPATDGLVLELDSARVVATPSAKPVTAVRRRLEVTGPRMVSELWMAAMTEADLIHHLRSELSKQPPP